MSLIDGLRYRLRALFGPERHARELGEEIDFHLTLDGGAHRGSDASGRARRRFGNVGRYKEETRTMSGLTFLDMLILKTLSVQSMHGYGIAQHIERLSGDVFAVEQGSLYPALARLQKQG